MKEGFVLPAQEQPSDEEIKLVNKFTKRIMKKDEIYIFSLVLCDNEIDRDYERFTSDALEKLSNLFIGKTGILDHDARAEKQLARIFWCKNEFLKKENSIGSNYCRLVAKAYIPRIKENESVIMQIDSGIKKEVSIRCLVGKRTCNICGNDICLCPHKKGHVYSLSGKEVTCHSILENPIDAYEWSFVAIPAQPSAGVIKTFSDNNGESTMEIIEKIKSESDKKGLTGIYKSIKSIENRMKIGDSYISEIKNEILKLFSLIGANLGEKVISKMITPLKFEELKKLRNSLKQKIFNRSSFGPQLAFNNNEQSSQLSEFKI